MPCDFCKGLKRAAFPCEFGSHLDRALKGQFVAGLASQAIKQKIFMLPDNEMKSFEDVQIPEREERAIAYSNRLTSVQVNSYRLSGR